MINDLNLRILNVCLKVNINQNNNWNIVNIMLKRRGKVSKQKRTSDSITKKMLDTWPLKSFEHMYIMNTFFLEVCHGDIMLALTDVSKYVPKG